VCRLMNNRAPACNPRMPEPLREERLNLSAPSFSLRNRAARALWSAVWLLLFRISPRPFHAWRCFLLRCFGAKLGRGCHIYPGVIVWAPWNLECGDNVGAGDRAILYNQARITLGNGSVISQGAHLCTGTHNYNSEKFELLAFPIRIGARAWVCAEAFVHPGIEVGEGAVIGARAVVTEDMPAWMVCAGHPCQPIKARLKVP
jgi:putative colanic acid biosynthesis acetyltransferase WcaF